MRAHAACFTAALLAAAAPGAARAADDGVYGRFDGDVELRLGAGVAFSAPGPSLCGSAAIIYLATAGIYVHYTDALGSDDAVITRSIATGIHIQPLFLGRYGSDLERGPPRLDLLIDSFALGVGAFWDAPREVGFGDDPGLELSIGVDFPVLADATGPFLGLRGALRWRAGELAGPPSDGIPEQRAMLSLTLSWHQITSAHLVDAWDRSAWDQRELGRRAAGP